MPRHSNREYLENHRWNEIRDSFLFGKIENTPPFSLSLGLFNVWNVIIMSMCILPCDLTVRDTIDEKPSLPYPIYRDQCSNFILLHCISSRRPFEYKVFLWIFSPVFTPETSFRFIPAQLFRVKLNPILRIASGVSDKSNFVLSRRIVF